MIVELQSIVLLPALLDVLLMIVPLLAVGRLVSLLHQVRHGLPHPDPPVHLQARHRALRRGALRGRDETNIFWNK